MKVWQIFIVIEIIQIKHICFNMELVLILGDLKFNGEEEEEDADADADANADEEQGD